MRAVYYIPVMPVACGLWSIKLRRHIARSSVGLTVGGNDIFVMSVYVTMSSLVLNMSRAIRNSLQ